MYNGNQMRKLSAHSLGKDMTLAQSLGGGDCGFDFEVGKQYLEAVPGLHFQRRGRRTVDKHLRWTVAANVESKWSTRKAWVEVDGNIAHLSLELIAN
jgi:hypothetical protein